MNRTRSATWVVAQYRRRLLKALNALLSLVVLASACVSPLVATDVEPGPAQRQTIVDLVPPLHEAALAGPRHEAPTIPDATLRAASGATIAFRTQNGRTRNDSPPHTAHLPHLVLHRNGKLTEPDERTLIVDVTGVKVPPPGVMVTLKVETQHSDPDVDVDSSKPIPVWHETRRIPNASGLAHMDVSVTFRRTFGATVMSGAEAVTTPTDYFRYEVTIFRPDHPNSGSVHTFGEDYAFLMENQWIVRLPEVAEASSDAAPDELIVYYCDMFPFSRCKYDQSTWLRREKVAGFVEAGLIPEMIEAFRIQTDDWGFPWYQEWTGYRSRADAERLSVALAEGKTWYHGEAPARGHLGISINVNGGKVEYDSLTDGVMSSFHHELFHNLQRSIDQHSGGKGDLDGKGDTWQFFSEGTAVLASAVGQPEVQFNKTKGARTYLSYARSFTGREEGARGDLNERYAEEMTAYHAAIYWRFLYEQCGGMKEGVEDAAAGMDIIRRSLTVLYSKEIVDIGASTELAQKIPQIMRRALAGSSCPFQTYEESLIAFARAVYALRLEDGRCTAPGAPASCGLYDPNALYHDPPVATIIYTGTMTYTAEAQPYPSGIPSSFGIDFVEVILDAAVDGQPLTIEFHGAPGADAEFNVQLWVLKDSGVDEKPRRVPTPTTTAEILSPKGPDDHLTWAIPAIDTGTCNRLGLIITRVDAKERLDPIGEYTIVVRPG